MLIPLINLVKKYNLKINGVIHVGAHYGEELFDYSKLKISSVHFFEPLEENFLKLQEEIIKFNSIDIHSHCCALGNDEGERKIYLSSNKLESSSLLEPDQHLVDHPEVSFIGESTVILKKLDQFHIENANFLNMDVQGYELEVLKGAVKTLNYIDYIYCEVNRSSTYKNNALIDDIDFFLSKYDFKRIETVWAGEKISWGDAFYIKKSKYKINFYYYLSSYFFRNILYIYIKIIYSLFRKLFK